MMSFLTETSIPQPLPPREEGEIIFTQMFPLSSGEGDTGGEVGDRKKRDQREKFEPCGGLFSG